MHKWHLLLFAFLAVCKPTVTFGEHSLADGQQQCCNRHSSFLLRDTRRSLHDSNRYIKSVDEDRRINLKALREIRSYDHEPREHSVAKIPAKDKNVNHISLQLNGRNIRQPFKNTKGKWNYEIARESIFGVYGSRQNQNQGTRLAVYYSRDTHRSHSSNPQEVREVTHDLLQGARKDAARPNRNVQRTIEYRLNDLRSVKRPEPRFDTNRESRVNFRMSRDIRETKESRDQVTRDDVARPYWNVQRTVEYRLDRLRRVARSKPRLDTTHESRVNSRISRDVGETTEIREQRTRNDVRSYRKVQLNVENRLNSFRSITGFEPRLNTNREHRVDSRIIQDVSKTAETGGREPRNNVVRSYRNVPLMVENRIASVIVTRSQPRFSTNREHRANSRISRDVRGTTKTLDQVTKDDVARPYRNAQRMVEYRLDRLRRVARSEPKLDTTRESRVNSRISRDVGETTEIREQRTRNDVRSYSKVQLNVENRLNSFRSITGFEPSRWNVRNFLKNEAVNNGHRGYTERRFETRGLVRDENRQDQRSREHTSSDYRHNMRQTLLQSRGVHVRSTLPKANNVQVYNDRASEINQKEHPKKETAAANWQYIFYTIQILYVCAVLHMGTEDKFRKTKKGYLGSWKSSQDTLKVE